MFPLLGNHPYGQPMPERGSTRCSQIRTLLFPRYDAQKAAVNITGRNRIDQPKDDGTRFSCTTIAARAIYSNIRVTCDKQRDCQPLAINSCTSGTMCNDPTFFRSLEYCTSICTDTADNGIVVAH